MLGGHKQNIEAIATLHKKAKDRLSLNTTAVPYIKAENETAIIPRNDTDEVWGYCGKKGQNHVCQESFVLKVEDDDGAYERLLEAFQNCQVAITPKAPQSCPPASSKL